MRRIRVYDRQALSHFYEREFPDVNIMMDWNHLEGPDRRIGLITKGDSGTVFPERGKPSEPSRETAARVRRALEECPWTWAEIDESPLLDS